LRRGRANKQYHPAGDDKSGKPAVANADSKPAVVEDEPADVKNKAPEANPNQGVKR
jgi:hypothetical protein